MTRSLALSLGIAVLAAFACGPRPTGAPATEQLAVFPPPPDTARIQFLTRISGTADLTSKGPSFWQRLVGQQSKTEAGIMKPYGIAMHQGRIYVCDTGAHAVEVIDLARRSLGYVAPRGVMPFSTPVNCAVDGDGRLYVADPDRGEVVILSDSGTYAGKLSLDKGRPGDVFASSDRLWVADLASGTIRVYDKASHLFLFSFPNAQPGAPDALAAPANIHVTADRVYVSDALRARVNIYSTDGRYLRSVGGLGDSPGRFSRPKGIAVDLDGNLYVADAAFDNVQVFNDQGQLLMFFGGPYGQPGDMSLPAGITIDYDNLSYFQQYVRPGFTLKYLILVTNQYGPDKISVYGFVGPTGRTKKVGEK